MIRFVIGVVAGAAGATAWLLSTPEPSQARGSATDLLGTRGQTLKARINEALAEGRAAEHETENRLTHQFETFRRHPNRPATS